jgi:hypothetical protein
MTMNNVFFTKPQLMLWLLFFCLISIVPFFFHSQIAYIELLQWKAAAGGQIVMLGLIPVLLAQRWWKRVIE